MKENAKPVETPSCSTQKNILETPAVLVKAKLNPLEVELKKLEKKLQKLEDSTRGVVPFVPIQRELVKPQKGPKKLSVKFESKLQRRQTSPFELELKRLNKTLKKLEDSTKNVKGIVQSSQTIEASRIPQESVDNTHPRQLNHLEKELEKLEKKRDSKGMKETLICPLQPKIVATPSIPTDTSMTSLNLYEKELKRLEKKMKKFELEDNAKGVSELEQTETNLTEVIKTPSEPQESILKAQPTPLNLMEKELRTLEIKHRKLTKSTNGVDMARKMDILNL